MIDLSAVNIIAELDRLKWTYEFAGDTELKCSCPFHKDKHPSCVVSTTKRVFKCHASTCSEDGDFVSFVARILQTNRRVVYEDFCARYGMEATKIIDPALVERYHGEIWKAKPLLKQLHDRGVTDKLIREYRLGFCKSRITIPITNANGEFVNIRRYMPGAPGPQKMRNTRGHGQIRLFPIRQLQYDTVMVCGGEIKALVAASILNNDEIGAVSTTGGEGNWDPKFSALFSNKRIYVCHDVDDEGHTSADKVCAFISKVASWVGRVTLPLNRDKYPHGDFNDWIGGEGATRTDVLALLKQTKEWEQETVTETLDDTECTNVSLSESVYAKHTGKRIRIKAVVSAIDSTPYVVPSRVLVLCKRDQDGCSLCPAFARDPDEKGRVEMSIHPESPSILDMVGALKKVLRQATMDGLGIPFCKTVQFKVVVHSNLEDVRLTPQLQITNTKTDHALLPALCTGSSLELNESYEVCGRMYPNPRTQQAVILASSYKTSKDALSTYDPNKAALNELKVFQSTEWTVEALDKKLNELYRDLSTNVTRIYKRQALHLAVDLAYHSALVFRFDGKLIKGWTEVLVLGDSSQGKTETSSGLMNHYGLGERMDCKNATVAGMLGGMQQIGTKWFVTWGVIPTHDRRLVILEELKGASTEVIAKLTDMRSTGIAEIPKIERRRTHARTRLIALSNPRTDNPLDSFSFGVVAVKELIGSLEDIRRFDYVLLLSSSDISVSELNKLQSNRPEVSHTFTEELCSRCVLWSWTRSPDQVRFEHGVEALVLEKASELCASFTEIIPIVDRGSMRYKLARLAVALAARTFSSSQDLKSILVRRCHVEYVCHTLVKTYESDTFGYRDFTDAVQVADTLIDTKAIETKLNCMPFPRDFVTNALSTTSIDLRDICDWCAWNREEALQALSFFVRKHALTRDGPAYRKTPPFIAMLKRLKYTIKGRPEHIGEQDEF